MNKKVQDLNTEQFERLLKEYRICQEQTSRLESYVWQTAGLLGVGAIVGLVSLISADITNACTRWTATIVAAVFATNTSLVWWRFARRWWSIQHLKFERMREIEPQLKFRQTILIEERDLETQKYRRHLQETGPRHQRVSNKLRFSIRSSVPPALPDLIEKVETYEYRGNQPVGYLLVLTIIALWFSITFSTALDANRLPLTAIIFAIVALVDFYVWRKP